MTPIFGDARFPEKYRSIVQGVHTVYADIAQPDQARILSENVEHYLDDKGEFLFAVKARSIDVSKDPSEIFRQEKTVLEENGYKVREMIRLDPFEKDLLRDDMRRLNSHLSKSRRTLKELLNDPAPASSSRIRRLDQDEEA
jgi:fibrillarin-like rRNA methylase